MSRFSKLSHTIWHYHYHVVWMPRYRFRILQGDVKQEVGNCILAFSEQKRCDVEELNVQIDHVYLMVRIPPKISVSDYVGIVEGKTAISVLNRFRNLRQKPYCGNHFLTRGSCVDTIGLDSEKIRAYVKYQERQEQQMEQRQLKLRMALEAR